MWALRRTTTLGCVTWSDRRLQGDGFEALDVADGSTALLNPRSRAAGKLSAIAPGSATLPGRPGWGRWQDVALGGPHALQRWRHVQTRPVGTARACHSQNGGAGRRNPGVRRDWWKRLLPGFRRPPTLQANPQVPKSPSPQFPEASSPMSNDHTPTTLILDHVYQHEAAQPDRVFLTQPVGGGEVVDFTWAQMLDQARRMAAHLQSLGLPPGARIAMLAKNSAHFFMAELAI